MDKFKKDRRIFLKNALIGAAGISSLTLLSSCTSFDEYLFEDRHTFNDEVMIIGGGISGLYLAHKLRNIKTDFRLFEGSATFGGRIKSLSSSDYGASLLSSNDLLAKQLVKELLLQTKALDKDLYYLSLGMQSLTEALLESIIGLIPYRNFRLRWKLTEIRKYGSGFELVLDSPSGVKRFTCKKIALAIPPSQWSSIIGLMDLPEMKWAATWSETLKIENSIKFILPVSSSEDPTKSLFDTNSENFNIRQIIKKNKAAINMEVDVRYRSELNIAIEDIYNILKKKMHMNYSFENLQSEQYFDWKQVKLIKGAKFMNDRPFLDSNSHNFQIIGDFASNSSRHTIEGALLSASRASELLL